MFKNIVESATNGEIKVEIFPNGQLGKDFEIAQQVRDGVIQASLASVGGLASHYPKIGVIDVAFAFPHISAVYDVFDGPFGEALARRHRGRSRRCQGSGLRRHRRLLLDFQLQEAGRQA